ncbi:uncharacterized protein PFL1_01765 [Pseudozyma flocculosa PF-1]|uniref:Related to Cytoplasmic acetyl-CoA hydrolase 1 n=1 Tax=Pseudozyma flocculosa TaxID=84751 RepID=A0A5C3EXZ6_9BASI|nr:uncharacterized protein PFL1_01765 [Pseudozyma flocculosa PF-1]EPQ30868.1 hypothetical protein PFL1_01765 [Pseudozyma flocculosa PF-1]SPO36760.1 related to Cytoplasmic acetyl-CoA hydrolase 1 [Pseudozyma flocculosa]
MSSSSSSSLSSAGNRPVELYTAAVAGLGALFFLAATYNVLAASLPPRRRSPRSDPRTNGSRTFATDGQAATTAAAAAAPPLARAAPGPAHATRSGTDDAKPPPGKTTDQSTVQVTYPTTYDMCDAGSYPEGQGQGQGQSQAQDHAGRTLHKVRAGALLRWIDVVAGVSARKHAESSCVTISVDSVLLLKPVYLGDLIHLSASVNRAWGSSMEVGVRVVKEDPVTGAKEYVSHSYLTFVAVARPDPADGGNGGGGGSGANQPPARVRLASRGPAPAPATTSAPTTAAAADADAGPGAGLWSWFGFSSSPSAPRQASSGPSNRQSGKVQLRPVIPQTPLEARRHIMAGRRRAKRIDNAKRGEARDGVSTDVKRELKDEVLELSRLGARRRSSTGPPGTEDGGGQPLTRHRLQFEEGDVKAAGSDLTGQGQSRTRQDIELDALELEFVVEAYVAEDPAVTVRQDQGIVEIHLPGDVPLRHPLDVVERLAKQVRRQQQLGQTTVDEAHLGWTAERLAAPLASPTGEAATATLELQPSGGSGREPKAAHASSSAGATAGAGATADAAAAGTVAQPTPAKSALERKKSVFSPLRGGSSGFDSDGEALGEATAKKPAERQKVSSSTYPPAPSSQRAEADTSAGASAARARRGHGRNDEVARPIDVGKTVARTLHLVFPEHTNSVSVLFGGQLMDWMEEAALLAVRHVGRGRRWSTVGLDGLEFEQAVGIGEVMSFTAIAVRSFRQSCEVYVLAEAEAPNGTRRLTNDALFTLAFPLDEVRGGARAGADADDGEGQQGRRMPQRKDVEMVTGLRDVVMPPSSALETFAAVAPQRRKARLEMRDMLNRLYSQPQ